MNLCRRALQAASSHPVDMAEDEIPRTARQQADRGRPKQRPDEESGPAEGIENEAG